MSESEVQRIKIPSNCSITSAKLIERLQEGKPGDTATDEELSIVAGLPTGVGKKGYNYLMTAQRFVKRQCGIEWFRVRGESMLKCGVGDELAERAQVGLSCIRRRTRRLGQTATIAKGLGVSPHLEKELNATISQVGAIQLLANGDAKRRLTARTQPWEPDKKRLLEMMGE